MTRNFRNFLFLFFGFVLGGVATYAAAETVAATQGRWARCTVTQSAPGLAFPLSADVATMYAAACAAAGGNWHSYQGCTSLPNGAGTVFGCFNGITNNQCPDASYTLDMATRLCSRSDCPIGETKNSAGVCSGTCYSLVVSPSGSCLKATTCSPGMEPGVAPSQPICADQKPDERCPAGGIVIGTFNGKPMCISPPPKDSTCDSLGGTVVGTINGQPICSQANNPTCPGGGASIGSVNGQPVCNSSCPSGQASGTVNGVTSCYPVSPTTNKTTTQKSTSQTTSNTTTSTDPGTPNSSSTSTSTTACEGTRCTTTTILNTGSGTVTSTKEEDKGDYCSKNPKASVCTGETEAEKFCEDNPDAISCMKAGSVPEEGALPSQANSISSINVVSVASNATCPADIPLPKGMKFEWGPICSWAEALRPIVLALAWLAAGLIVLGVNF